MRIGFVLPRFSLTPIGGFKVVYEIWDGPKEQVDETWTLPLHKIVIARWLYDLAQQHFHQNEITYIPNGIDFNLL